MDDMTTVLPGPDTPAIEPKRDRESWKERALQAEGALEGAAARHAAEVEHVKTYYDALKRDFEGRGEKLRALGAALDQKDLELMALRQVANTLEHGTLDLQRALAAATATIGALGVLTGVAR